MSFSTILLALYDLSCYRCRIIIGHRTELLSDAVCPRLRRVSLGCRFLQLVFSLSLALLHTGFLRYRFPIPLFPDDMPFYYDLITCVLPETTSFVFDYICIRCVVSRQNVRHFVVYEKCRFFLT